MLSKKVMWITGASKGIGKSIADYAELHNAIVYNSSRNNHPNKKIHNIFADFSKTEDIQNAHSKIMEEQGKVDILINNAGIAYFKEFNDFSISEFEQMCHVNLRGTFSATQLVLENMLKRKSGIIVNILSAAVYKTFTFSSLYAATKAAIRAMSNSLREEVRKDGVKVINIYPGATKTDIWDENMQNEFGKVMSSPDDVAETVISSIIFATKNGNSMIEEVILKPQNGDL
jgi:short-subunit dehydrogenase